MPLISGSWPDSPTTICGLWSSASPGALRTRVAPITPPPVCSRSQRDMSRALELIDPAGPTASMLRNGISETFASRSWYGFAKSAVRFESSTEKLLAVMPSGVKIRARTRSSQVVPATSPAR